MAKKDNSIKLLNSSQAIKSQYGMLQITLFLYITQIAYIKYTLKRSSFFKH